jgi:hypothetical protein
MTVRAFNVVVRRVNECGFLRWRIVTVKTDAASRDSQKIIVVGGMRLVTFQA